MDLTVDELLSLKVAELKEWLESHHVPMPRKRQSKEFYQTLAVQKHGELESELTKKPRRKKAKKEQSEPESTYTSIHAKRPSPGSTITTRSRTASAKAAGNENAETSGNLLYTFQPQVDSFLVKLEDGIASSAFTTPLVENIYLEEKVKVERLQKITSQSLSHSNHEGMPERQSTAEERKQPSSPTSEKTVQHLMPEAEELEQTVQRLTQEQEEREEIKRLEESSEDLRTQYSAAEEILLGQQPVLEDVIHGHYASQILHERLQRRHPFSTEGPLQPHAVVDAPSSPLFDLQRSSINLFTRVKKCRLPTLSRRSMAILIALSALFTAAGIASYWYFFKKMEQERGKYR